MADLRQRTASNYLLESFIRLAPAISHRGTANAQSVQVHNSVRPLSPLAQAGVVKELQRTDMVGMTDVLDRVAHGQARHPGQAIGIRRFLISPRCSRRPRTTSSRSESLRSCFNLSRAYRHYFVMMDFLWRNITAESRPDRVQKVDLLWREVRSACFDCGWPQMIFEKHVGDTRLFAV